MEFCLWGSDLVQNFVQYKKQDQENIFYQGKYVHELDKNNRIEDILT